MKLAELLCLPVMPYCRPVTQCLTTEYSDGYGGHGRLRSESLKEREAHGRISGFGIGL